MKIRTEFRYMCSLQDKSTCHKETKKSKGFEEKTKTKYLKEKGK